MSGLPATLARTAALAGALWLCAASGPGPNPVPEPDSCEGGGDAGEVTAVSFGGPTEGDFVEWSEGEQVFLTIGGQGTAMLGVRLRLSGPTVPECLAHQTELWADGGRIAGDSIPVHTYDDARGGRTTLPMFLILDGPEPAPGDPIEVRTTIGAQTRTISLELGQ